MSKFYIGASTWPGISKLIEECGEVLQVCGKLIATDGEHKHWDGSNLKCRLQEELGDLLAAIEFTANVNHLDTEYIKRRVADKLAKFMLWHQTQRPVPDLTAQCDTDFHTSCDGKLYYRPGPNTAIEMHLCLCPCHGVR